MQVKKNNNSETSVTVTIIAKESELAPIKSQVIKRLGKDLKLAGFRPGKAPENVIEKNLDQNLLQTEVIENAINQMYPQAMQGENLRPVANPNISVKKFVPFTDLEFEATVDVIGEIKLPDYKKIKKTKESVKVTAKDIDEVIEQIKTRSAERKEVKRAAKNGDQVTIDFKGVDTKKKPINGAGGKEYPLVLGSDTFIPGFEKNLIGMKAGDEKTFDLVFPKDYGVKALANKKVTFTVTVQKVEEMIAPTLDDKFAASVGPFKSVDQLKEDIKTQLTTERQSQADRKLESDLVEEIAKKSKVAVPESLLNEQIESMIQEQRQNLMYRGQTFEEFLKEEGKTEEAYRKDVLKPQAEQRVKIGLVLSEISVQENLDVTPEELEVRIQLLKGQYQDAKMQEELDKPENRRDIAMRMLTEKTLNKLVNYVTGK